MKDIRGRDIEVGDHVIYVRSISDRNFEEGIITVCKEDCVQIDYMGDGNGVSATKIRRGRITATSKKIIVLNIGSSPSPAVEIFNNERKRFESEMKKMKAKMQKVLEVGEALATENELLQEEVGKIRGRWNILDFS